MERIRAEIITEANLFIGDNPSTFEIGGIDLYTKTDYNNRPQIPASSIKGTMRKIVRDMESEEIAVKIKESYKRYLENLKRNSCEQNKKMQETNNGSLAERLSRLEAKMDDAINNASVQYLFGIKAFNDTPKLIFSDFNMKDPKEKAPFSVDTKNTIENQDDPDKISSNPRTYKTVRPGITFCGEIIFYHLDALEEFDLSEAEIKKFVESVLLKFNEGVYRLGNSGSRGYGKIHVKILGE